MFCCYMKNYMISMLLIDPCMTMPCQQNEECARIGSGQRICRNPCNSSPCMNSGTCVPGTNVTRYTCICGAYTGINCEIGESGYLIITIKKWNYKCY